MKKLAKTLILALLFVPMLFACEPLSGDLGDISSTQSDITLEGGGGEDGGEAPPDGKPG